MIWLSAFGRTDAPANGPGQTQPARVCAAGNGHSPGDVTICQAVPRVGDTNGPARTVVTEGLVTAEPEQVIRFLENNAPVGSERQHHVLSCCLNLRDGRNRAGGQ
jgi:hypothetical protein